MLTIASPTRSGPKVSIRLTSAEAVRGLAAVVPDEVRKALLAKLRSSQRTGGSYSVQILGDVGRPALQVEIQIPFGERRRS